MLSLKFFLVIQLTISGNT